MKLLSLETIRLGLNNLRLHKLRSVLTSLGIIFGVAAVICMLSISEGASADEMRMIRLLGTRNIIVNSVKPPQTAQTSQTNTNMIEYGITRDDVAIIEETVVLPCAPETAMLYFNFINSASISARGSTEISSRWASATSGFSGRMAEEITTARLPRTCNAMCPWRMIAPKPANLFVTALDFKSEPLTE